MIWKIQSNCTDLYLSNKEKQNLLTGGLMPKQKKQFYIFNKNLCGHSKCWHVFYCKLV